MSRPQHGYIFGLVGRADIQVILAEIEALRNEGQHADDEGYE